MGRRAPVIIVDSLEKVEEIKNFCSSTMADDDEGCDYVGYKVHAGRYYVCIDTDTYGLEQVIAGEFTYPKWLVTRVPYIQGQTENRVSHVYQFVPQHLQFDWASQELIEA